MTPNDPTNSIASLGQEAELTVEQILSLTEHINTLAKSLKEKEKTTKQLIDLYGHEYATKKGLISLNESLDLRTKDFASNLKGMQSIFQGFSTSGAIGQLTKGINGIPLIMAAAAVSILKVIDSTRAELNRLQATSSLGYGNIEETSKNPFSVAPNLSPEMFNLNQSLIRAGMKEDQRSSLYRDARATGVGREDLPTVSKELLLGVQGFKANPADVSNIIGIFTRRLGMSGDAVSKNFQGLANQADGLNIANFELFEASSQLLNVFSKMSTEGVNTTTFFNEFGKVLKDKSVSLSALTGTLTSAREAPYDQALGQAYLMNQYSSTFGGAVDPTKGIATQYSQYQDALKKDGGAFMIQSQTEASLALARQMDPKATEDELSGIAAHIGRSMFGMKGELPDIQNLMNKGWEGISEEDQQKLKDAEKPVSLEANLANLTDVLKTQMTTPERIGAWFESHIKEAVFKTHITNLTIPKGGPSVLSPEYLEGGLMLNMHKDIPQT